MSRSAVAEAAAAAGAARVVLAGAELKARLRAYAESLGVTRLGVTSADPFWEEAAILAERRRRGYASRFEEPGLLRRVDPRQTLPGAKSIVSLAVSYYVPRRLVRTTRPDRPKPRLRGWLSRYVWGQDYHRVLHRIMAQLIAWLREHAPEPFEAVAMTDTGALVDRAVARRAGVGWIGKNGLLIVPGAGSWVFLGQILTTLELPPDDLLPEDCGACLRCLEACPTGAIVRPYEIAAPRCLSELTQWRQDVPEALRPAFGRRLFGCDTCQDVCPKNQDVLFTALAEFRPPPPPSPNPELAPILGLSKRAFRETWGASAAAWRGRKVVQRNAVVALGNSRDPAALGPLAGALADARPAIRRHAAWALGRLGSAVAAVRAEAAGLLRAALAREGDRRTREELVRALGRLPGGAAASACGREAP